MRLEARGHEDPCDPVEVPGGAMGAHGENNDRAAELRYARGQADWLIGLYRQADRNPTLAEQAYAVLGPPTDTDYVLPAHFSKLIPPAALRRLQGLLVDLRAIAEGLVGLSDIEARVLYNGDDSMAVV